jgi:hypothetical protein
VCEVRDIGLLAKVQRLNKVQRSEVTNGSTVERKNKVQGLKSIRFEVGTGLFHQL